LVSMVALTSLQVCKSCAERNKECHPIWYHCKGNQTVRCVPCMEAKHGCSFRDFDWNIQVWPRLVPTEAGNRRRAKAAEARRRVTTKKAEGMDSESEDVAPKVAARTQAKGKGKATQDPPKKTQGPPKKTWPVEPVLPATNVGVQNAGSQVKAPFISQPEAGPSSKTPHYDVWVRAKGRDERVFLENPAMFEEALVVPTRSATTVGMALAEVQSVIQREESQIAILTKLAESRRVVLKDVEGRLAAEAKRLREKKDRMENPPSPGPSGEGGKEK
jgi:hypothetical protein